MLIHLVSATQDDVVAAYREVRTELEQFGQGLGEKQEVVILSKIDEVEPAERETKMAELASHTGREVLAVSILDSVAIKDLADRLTELLRS